MSDQRGLTLVELIVSFAIISVLAGISFAVYQKMLPRITLSSATRDITSDLRYAQQKAVTEQIVYDVKFNIAGNSYQIIKEVPTTTIKTVNLGTKIIIKTITGITSSTVKFNSAGGAFAAGQITLMNTANATTSINIKPSGYVEIQGK